MAADDYEIGNMAAALAAICGRWQRVRAITLDETPSGVAEMHARAGAPPISHVVNELEARRPVGYAQYKAAVRASYRLGSPHVAQRPREHRAEQNGQKEDGKLR